VSTQVGGRAGADARLCDEGPRAARPKPDCHVDGRDFPPRRLAIGGRLPPTRPPL